MLAGAGLEKNRKRCLFPKEVFPLPHSLLQDVMLKFPLSPKEENPRVVTRHKEVTLFLEAPFLKMSGEEGD